MQSKRFLGVVMFSFKAHWSFIASIVTGVILLSPAVSYGQSVLSTTSSPRALQQAMSTDDHIKIYESQSRQGFSLSGGFFSGTATGNDTQESWALNTSSLIDHNFEHAAELEHDQRVYALLIDGSYDFNYDFGSGLPLHPYVNGGMGMAMADHTASSTTVMMQGGDVVPLFRLGGGVTYRLGEEWNLSLDYRTGFSGTSASDQMFTGRGQQPVDLQILNMGMHFKF